MKDIVTKSNFFVTAYYKLTLTEMQILIYAIRNINPFENEHSCLRQKIRVVDFAKKFNREHKEIYQDIQDAVENRLWERKITFWNKQEQGMQKTRLVSTVIYSDLKGDFVVQFPIELKPLVVELKSNFTSYYLKNVSKFRSVYSLRVYEICSMEVNKSKSVKSFFEISYDEIKNILMIVNKYHRFIDFKRRVLEKSKSEINTHSDLEIDFKEIKESRKVVAIQFIVQRKDGTKRASYAREEENQVGTEVEFCHDKKESSREGENFAMTKNKKTTEVPAYPPQVQNGNCTYKDSDTQTISKLSSSDNKVNTVIQKSGCDAKSHILETKGDITTEPKFCHGKKNAIEKTDSNDKNFAMAKNANGILPQTDEYEKHETLLAQMCKYNLKRKRALDLIEDYGGYACRLGIANFEKVIEFGGQIDNAAGYLTRCIENATELVKGSDEIKAERMKEFVDETLSCLNLEKQLQLRKNPLVKKKEAVNIAFEKYGCGSSDAYTHEEFKQTVQDGYVLLDVLD